MADEKTAMIQLTIDGKEITVPKGTTVYMAAQKLGIEIPIFCYHDRMPPFGACRQCLVEVEKSPKLQTSCTLEATDGMVVKTQTQMAVEGRKQILEFLLINHPLDCPICDRGGECPLQDQTIKFGPGKSRFYEEKRHFSKRKPLGPVLMLDRERCITCARCTRFGDIVAGDNALEFIDRGYRTEVGTPDGGPAESKFIGNTIMICPVGALTSEVYRFRARPWDNDSANSTCTLCPVGCSMILDSRDGEIVRTRSLENREVNDIWLCDKGWFGYEFSSHPDRLTIPLIRQNGSLQAVSWEEALAACAEKIKSVRPNRKIAGFGGNPLTIEENYLFQRLMREGFNVNHVDHRIGMPIMGVEDEGLAPGMEMNIGECEELSYAVLCGIDITEEFPVIWLRLKQAINRGAKVIFLGHYAPEVARHLENTILHAPGQELKIIQEQTLQIQEYAKSGKGAIFVGRQYLHSPQRLAILSELHKLRTPNLRLNILDGRGNSMGARFAGMRPDLGPFEKPIAQPGYNAIQVLEQAAESGWDFLYVAGANPAKKFPAKLWNEAKSKLGFLVVQDLFLTETAKQADVVLPALSFVEKEGSFLNIERRLQKLRPGKAIPNDMYTDGEIFIAIAKKLGLELKMEDDFAQKLQQGRLFFDWPEKIPTPKSTPGQVEGSLLATFAPSLFDNGVRMAHDPHVIQLSKGPKVRLHPQNGSFKDGDKVQVNGTNLTGIVKLDSRVAEGTVVLPLGFDDFLAQELGSSLLNGLKIDLRKA